MDKYDKMTNETLNKAYEDFLKSIKKEAELSCFWLVGSYAQKTKRISTNKTRNSVRNIFGLKINI